MPQIKSAKKALRSDLKKRAFNDKWRVKYRAGIKAVSDAITSGDAKAAQAAFTAAQRDIDRASRRNIINPNTASRKKSRMQKAILKMGVKK